MKKDKLNKFRSLIVLRRMETMSLGIQTMSVSMFEVI